MTAPTLSILSATGWRRLRKVCTATVFIAATVAGVVLGVQAVDVSPVAPVSMVAAAAAVAPAPPAAQPVPAVVAPNPVGGGQRGRDGGGQGGGRGGGPGGGR